jgi:hypothetical protein
LGSQIMKAKINQKPRLNKLSTRAL